MPLYVSLELNFTQFLLIAKTIKLLYGHILECCQRIYSILTDHRRKRGFVGYIIDNLIFRTQSCAGFPTEFTGIPCEFD